MQYIYSLIGIRKEVAFSLTMDELPNIVSDSGGEGKPSEIAQLKL